MRQVSYDLSLSRPLELADGRPMTALEMQWEHLDLARKYAEDRGLESRGRRGDRRGHPAPLGTRADRPRIRSHVAGHQLDWVAKYRVINGYRERHDLAWDDPKLAAMDLQYHDVRPEKSLYARLGVERLTTDDEVGPGGRPSHPRPPGPTSGGSACSGGSDDIAAANWDSLVFDLGRDPLRRVPMMEPTRGTEAHVGTLLADCSTSSELLDRLGT